MRRARALWPLLLTAACGGSAAPPPEHPTSTVETPPEVRALPGFDERRVTESVFEGEVHVTLAGATTAPPMVLVHGLGARASADWYPVIARLAQSYRVVALDLPGFGRSSAGNHLYAPDRYAAVIDEVTRSLGIDTFVLVGHSLGGSISLEYAATHPERVTRLVLIDAAGILHRDAYTAFLVHTQLEGPLGSAATTLMSPFTRRQPDPAMFLDSAATRSAILGADPTKIAALALIEHNFGGALDAVRAPTLILWGEQDEVAPLRTGQLLESRLPQTTLSVLAGAGHVPMTEDPAWVTTEILDWLAAEPTVAGPPPEPGQRIGRCEDEREQRVFEGAYMRIEAERCGDVVLRGVVAEQIVLRDTVATLDDVQLAMTDGSALVLEESVVRMTGGHIMAPHCVRLSGSELDAAGTTLACSRTAFVAQDRSKLILSVTRVASPHTQEHLHGIRVVDPGAPL